MFLELYPKTQLFTLKKIKRNLATRIPYILESIGIYMEASIIENFQQQGRPEKWCKNAPATLEKKKGNLILHESGHLEFGIRYSVDETHREVIIGPTGPALPYAVIRHLSSFICPIHPTRPTCLTGPTRIHLE